MSTAFLSRPGSTLGGRVAGLARGECFVLDPAAQRRTGVDITSALAGLLLRGARRPR